MIIFALFFGNVIKYVRLAMNKKAELRASFFPFLMASAVGSSLCARLTTISGEKHIAFDYLQIIMSPSAVGGMEKQVRLCHTHEMQCCSYMPFGKFRRRKHNPKTKRLVNRTLTHTPLYLSSEKIQT